MANTEELNRESLEMHAKNHGKLEVRCKVPLENGHDLSIAYTPVCSRTLPQDQREP